MKSSSESISGLAVVSGVGGAAAAEAILLLDRVVLSLEDVIASAAFLFRGWEEMMSKVKWCLYSSQKDECLRTQGCHLL